ncbi:MAG: 3'-5' exonuclease [Cyclobacteriaceae bacterium]|nr:3'-5' exonuclease [Cyclobacteriaceae bacterium]
MDKSLKDILIIDIETVSAQPALDKLPSGLQDHWKRKASFLHVDEEATPEQLYVDRGAIYAEFGKVIVIAIGIFHELADGQTGLRVTSFQNHDETALLLSFTQFLDQKIDQKKIRFCAHNGKEFDYPYLCRRMLVKGISIPPALNLSGKKPWEVNHLDTMEMWKFGDRKSFTSLDLLSHLFGIASSKTDIDGSQVNHVYYSEEKGLDRIATYCKGDVIATAQLYLKLHNLPVIESNNITQVGQKTP